MTPYGVTGSSEVHLIRNLTRACIAGEQRHPRRLPPRSITTRLGAFVQLASRCSTSTNFMFERVDSVEGVVQRNLVVWHAAVIAAHTSVGTGSAAGAAVSGPCK